MATKISKPLSFSEIGRKDNQEDRICPDNDSLSPAQRCLVLCDGMGGHERGEVAAQIVSTELWKNLDLLIHANGDVDEKLFNIALSKTYDALDQMEFETEKRPGTTMTSVVFNDNGSVIVAHIGDSRVYQVRPGVGVVFRTSDHSLVNELVKAGELTEEEAVNFPRRNIITRAMQPRLDHRPAADIRLLTDIHPGDYFFMCTDGILEQMTDSRLVEILSAAGSDEDKLTAIFNQCFNKTRDNFTCILVRVEKADKTVIPVSPIAQQEPKQVHPIQQEETKKPNLKALGVIAIVSLAVIALAAYYFISSNPSADVEIPDVDTIGQDDSLHHSGNPPVAANPNAKPDSLEQSQADIDAEVANGGLAGVAEIINDKLNDTANKTNPAQGAATKQQKPTNN